MCLLATNSAIAQTMPADAVCFQISSGSCNVATNSCMTVSNALGWSGEPRYAWWESWAAVLQVWFTSSGAIYSASQSTGVYYIPANESTWHNYNMTVGPGLSRQSAPSNTLKLQWRAFQGWNTTLMNYSWDVQFTISITYASGNVPTSAADFASNVSSVSFAAVGSVYWYNPAIPNVFQYYYNLAPVYQPTVSLCSTPPPTAAPAAVAVPTSAAVNQNSAPKAPPAPVYPPSWTDYVPPSFNVSRSTSAATNLRACGAWLVFVGLLASLWVFV